MQRQLKFRYITLSVFVFVVLVLLFQVWPSLFVSIFVILVWPSLPVLTFVILVLIPSRNEQIRINNLPTLERKVSVSSKRTKTSTHTTPDIYTTDANGTPSMITPSQTSYYTNYYITFRFTDGTCVEFKVSKDWYESLKSGDTGKLYSKENVRFVSFQRY